jgi:phenolic acid decarboxylase
MKNRYSLYRHPSLSHDVWVPTGTDVSTILPPAAEKIAGKLMTPEEFQKFPELTVEKMTIQPAGE